MSASGLGTLIPWGAPKAGDIMYRQSTREAMALCGGKVLLRGKQDEPVSLPMSRGSFTHKMIELTILGKEAGLHDLDVARGIWDVVALEDGFKLDDVASPGLIEQTVVDVVNAWMLWVDWFWEPHGQYLHSLAVEELRVIPLGLTPSGRGAWLQGTPDWVTTQGIEDFKTSGRGWNEGKYLTRLQAQLYALLEREAGTITTPVDFSFQVYDFSRREWTRDEHSLVVTDEMIDAGLLLAWQDVLAIDSGALTYHPYGESYGKYRRGWHCSAKYCGVWEKCQAKYVIDDGKADDEVDRHWG